MSEGFDSIKLSSSGFAGVSYSECPAKPEEISRILANETLTRTFQAPKQQKIAREVHHEKFKVVFHPRKQTKKHNIKT